MFLRTALHIGGNMDIIHRVLDIDPLDETAKIPM